MANSTKGKQREFRCPKVGRNMVSPYQWQGEPSYTQSLTPGRGQWAGIRAAGKSALLGKKRRKEKK